LGEQRGCQQRDRNYAKAGKPARGTYVHRHIAIIMRGTLMPAGKPIAGLYAAVLAPKDTTGMLDERAFRSLVGFLHGKTLDRVVLNGATGEYCVNSPDDLRRMLGICRDTFGTEGEFLAGIGAAGMQGTMALADVAQEFGAKALLLPMPHFF